MSLATSTTPLGNGAAGRGWLWLGVALALGAIGVELVQLFVVKWLFTPWYLLVLGPLSVICLLYSVMQRPSLGRLIVLVFFTLLAGFEWWLLLGFTRVPAYTGPATGEPFPPFQAIDAEGKPFTERDFISGAEDTILVLFRGHW